MGREIEFHDVAARSGVAEVDIEMTEKGSVSGKTRRIAEFDWGQLRRAAAINGPTDIAITFADYLGVSNREADSFDSLNVEAKDFISRVERVSGAPVNLVSKKFAKNGVLKKDPWND
jgi:adenylosuccinate synthase